MLHAHRCLPLSGELPSVKGSGLILEIIPIFHVRVWRWGPQQITGFGIPKTSPPLHRGATNLQCDINSRASLFKARLDLIWDHIFTMLLPIPYLTFLTPLQIFPEEQSLNNSRSLNSLIQALHLGSLPRQMFYYKMILKGSRHLSLVHIYKHSCIVAYF